MVTLGIDFAANAKNTAACRVIWESGRAEVSPPVLNANDPLLIHLATDVEKAGIDVPFGWPEGFVNFVSAHKQGENCEKITSETFRLRRTDLYLWEQTGRQPLTVSPARIGIAAFRAA